MKSINEDERETRRAVEHLKSDKRCWTWCMSVERFDEILSAYKRIKPTNSISRLAMNVMGYGNFDKNDATSQFRKVRLGQSRTNGWAIFRLAHEISTECGIAVNPTDFAEPTGKNGEASRAAMEYLWSFSNTKEKLIAANPKVQELYRSLGLDLPDDVIVSGIMDKLRQRFKKFFGFLLPPFDWQDSNNSRKAILGIAAAVSVAILVMVIVTASGGVSLTSWQSKMSKDLDGVTSVDSYRRSYKSDINILREKPSREDSSPSVSDAPSILEAQALQKSGNSKNSSRGTEKANSGTQNGVLNIGLNTNSGGFTLSSYATNEKGAPLYLFSKTSEDCDTPLSNSEYFMCHFSDLPPGAYEIEFSSSTGFITPSTKQVMLTTGEANIVGNYIKE